MNHASDRHTGSDVFDVWKEVPRGIPGTRGSATLVSLVLNLPKHPSWAYVVEPERGCSSNLLSSRFVLAWVLFVL